MNLSWAICFAENSWCKSVQQAIVKTFAELNDEFIKEDTLAGGLDTSQLTINFKVEVNIQLIRCELLQLIQKNELVYHSVLVPCLVFTSGPKNSNVLNVLLSELQPFSLPHQYKYSAERVR